MTKIIAVILITIGPFIIRAQNVGINTNDPEFIVDVRGTDNTTSGGELQLATPGQTNFLRFFGGRLGDPNPFMAFSDNDTFHLVTTAADFSTYKRRMSIYPTGEIGMGTDKPDGSLHVVGGSSMNFPTLRLTDTLDNFARIKMETVYRPDRYWDIAASTTTDFSYFNIYFRDTDTTGSNLFQIDPKYGQFINRSNTPDIYTTFLTDKNNYRGYTGFFGPHYYINVADSGQLRFGTKNAIKMVMDTLGRVGLGTLNPKAEIDIRTSSADDGSELHLSNNNQTHFLRLFSGRLNLKTPIMYWNHGDTLNLGRAFSDESNYQSFLSLNGKTIGVHNTGHSIFIGKGAGEMDDLNDNINVAIGDSSLHHNVTGGRNVVIGKNALLEFTNGFRNVVIGDQAAYNSISGIDNTFVGASVCFNAAGGNSNTIIGSQAGGYLNSGTGNTALGHLAGFGIIDGIGNVYIGYGTGANQIGSPNSGNVLIGQSSGLQEPGNMNTVVGGSAGINIEGERNVVLGHGAANTLTSFDNCVIIGADTGEDHDRDNTLIIDNSNTATPLIYGEFDNNLVRINGNQDLTGELDITKTGVALRIDGDEAIWYNGTYFSYGFGADHNYMGRPLRIGPVEGSTTAYADMHVVDSGLANLSIESHSSDAVLQLAGNSNDANDHWTMRRVGSNGNLEWRHNLLKKMVMNNAGDLGLAVSNPLHKFDMSGIFNQTHSVNGAFNYIARFHNTGNNNSFSNDGIMVMAGHNSWTSSNQSRFIEFRTPDNDVVGGIRQNSSSSIDLVTSSDRRLKKNISNTQYGLAEVLKIRVADYHWKSDDDSAQKQTGFIAQELNEVYQQAVKIGGDNPSENPWSVSKTQLIPLLVKGMQEQHEIIDQQNQKITLLNKSNQELEARLEKLEAIVLATLTMEKHQ